MTGLFLVTAMMLNAPFDVFQFPLPSPQTVCFLARVEPTGSAELFLLDEKELTLYLDAHPEQKHVITLRPGTSALDVADINGDGRAELVCIVGNRVMRYSLPTTGNPNGTELFQIDSQYSRANGEPFLCPLIFEREGVAVIALPEEETLEFRTMSGELMQAVPLLQEDPAHPVYGQPFAVKAADTPQTGDFGSLEFRVSEVAASIPAPGSTEGFLQPSRPRDETLAGRRGTSRHLVEAANLPPDAWPWFPLRTRADSPERVLFAAADEDIRELLVRLRREVISPDTGAPGFEAGAARRYPGMLVTQGAEQPDFDGDGYVDLFLWNVAEPGVTVNALTKAAMAGTWPVTLLAYLFDPLKGRFEPRAAGHLTLEVPLAWYLSTPTEAPLHQLVLKDFNGDTRTDFGCSTAPDEFSAWLFSDRGFSPSPEIHQTFPAPVQQLEFVEDLNGRGRTSVAFRTGDNIILIRPGSELPMYPPTVIKKDPEKQEVGVP